MVYSESGGFVAWETDGLSITDSIFAPQRNSTIIGGTALLTNSLYIQALGTAQGKQTHSVKAAQGVDISFGGVTTNYDVSKLAKYKHGLGYNGVFYAAKDEQIDLTMPDLSAQKRKYVASAGELNGSGTKYTLVMPDKDVVISMEAIPAVSIKDAKVVISKTAFTYNSTVQKPTIKTIKGLTLKEGTDYTAKWSNASSTNAGTYTVTITGKGDYAGTTKATYKINKAANPLTVEGKTKTLTFNSAAAQPIAATAACTVSNAQGAVTYEKGTEAYRHSEGRFH